MQGRRGDGSFLFACGGISRRRLRPPRAACHRTNSLGMSWGSGCPHEHQHSTEPGCEGGAALVSHRYQLLLGSMLSNAQRAGAQRPIQAWKQGDRAIQTFRAPLAPRRAAPASTPGAPRRLGPPAAKAAAAAAEAVFEVRGEGRGATAAPPGLRPPAAAVTAAARTAGYGHASPAIPAIPPPASLTHSNLHSRT